MGKAKTLLLARRAAFIEQGGRCFWCDIAMMTHSDKGWNHKANRKVLWSADHLVPRSHIPRGSPDQHVRKNIVVACVGCNSSRGNRPLWEWVAHLETRLSPQALVSLLQRLTKLGISQPQSGHPSPEAPAVDHTPIVRAPEVDTLAP